MPRCQNLILFAEIPTNDKSKFCQKVELSSKKSSPKSYREEILESNNNNNNSYDDGDDMCLKWWMSWLSMGMGVWVSTWAATRQRFSLTLSSSLVCAQCSSVYIGIAVYCVVRLHSTLCVFLARNFDIIPCTRTSSWVNTEYIVDAVFFASFWISRRVFASVVVSFVANA